MPHVEAAGVPAKPMSGLKNWMAAVLLQIIGTNLMVGTLAFVIGVSSGLQRGHSRGVSDALNHPERFERVQADPQWVVKGGER